jgi:hypothetical protein
MTIEILRSFFLWCTILNYALLILWAVLATAGRGWWYELVNRIFPVSRDHFDLVNYAGIALYKMAVFLFNLVPLISLYIIK